MKNQSFRVKKVESQNVGDEFGGPGGFVGPEHANSLCVECVSVSRSTDTGYRLLRWSDLLVANGSRYIRDDTEMFVAYVC